MGSGIIGVVIAAAVGSGVALAATLGTVTVMSSTPDPATADQAPIVQYADE